MPPKKAPTKKLHELAPEVRTGFKILDVSKKTYIVGKQFATGGFGRIHICTEEGKSHQMVMKIEPSTNGPLLTEVVVFNRILKQEHLEAYKKRKKISWIGLPYAIANGFFQYNGEKMRYMVIPKYALSLEGAREANGGTLSVKQSMAVTNCVLDALEYLHSVDYTHADVKAANILLEKEGVYTSAVLVDFGLAHKTTNNVDKPDKKRAHNGTCIFTSTDAHRGNNPSYRGDVEILAYNIVMWLTGTLPWLSLESNPDKVFEAKQKFIAGLPGTLENTLQGAAKAAVGCLTTMFKMSMTTGYTSNMDMDKLRKLVTETMQKAPDAAKSKPSTSSAPTPKKSARRPAKVVEDEDDEEEEVKPKKKSGRSTKKVVVDDDDGEEEEEAKPKKKSGKVQKKLVVEKDEDEEEEDVKPKTKSGRTVKKVVVEDDDETEVEKPKKTSSRIKSKPRRIIDDDDEVAYTPKPSKSRSQAPEEEDEFLESDEDSELRPRSSRSMKTSSTTSSTPAAKKVEQKYKRMHMNKSSMVPVTISIAPSPRSSMASTSSGVGAKRSSEERLEETITLKTPALLPPVVKKSKYKSGISSATKASPTELRRVPGVRNFPKGRRSMIIKETAAKYSERRGRQQTQPTFNDSSCSGDSSEL